MEKPKGGYEAEALEGFDFSSVGHECDTCGCDWAPLHGDGTWAKEYECDHCWTMYAEANWDDDEDKEDVLDDQIDTRKEFVAEIKRWREMQPNVRGNAGPTAAQE